MALTDMMQHYKSVKERYEDCIVFYRLGDFYEMFFEDAIKVSKMLDLTLTGRDCGDKQRAPMCGVPYHAVDTYIAKLVAAGEKIAICDQLSEPTKGKALVERDVVRVVTAGTLIEEGLLDEGKNNYIACLFKDTDLVAAAWTDITTGEFLVEEFIGETAIEDAVSQMLTLSVAEIICNEDMLLAAKELKEVKHKLLPAFSCYMPWAFNVKHAEKNLLEQCNAHSLSAFGLAGKDGMISAAGALVEYLRETQKHSLSNISTVKVVQREDYMILDGNAVKNLELVRNNAEGKKYGSLLWVLDKTKTGMGARLLNRMLLSPLQSVADIEYRQEGVEELVNSSVVRMSIADTLKEIYDIERISGKISNGNLMPKDCISLAKSLSMLPSLKFQLAGFTSPVLTRINEGLIDLKQTTDLLFAAIDENAPALMKDGKYIRQGFNAELDELREIKENSRGILKQIEQREKELVISMYNNNIPIEIKLRTKNIYGIYKQLEKSGTTEIGLFTKLNVLLIFNTK